VTRGYEAPRGETERALAEVWAELLGVEQVGRHDHFFELGGHSLLAVKLVERMRRRGLHADVRALFTTPTLAGLAAAVGGETREVEVPANAIPAGARAITPEMLPLVELTQEEIDRVVEQVPGGAANVQDVYPLAPLQEGVLFHHLMSSEGDPYLTATLAAFDTRARLDAFAGALQAVVGRHDILRTAVLWEGLPEPVQVVWREARLEVEETELDPAAGDVARQLFERFDPRRFRIDVRRAPLLRVCIAHDPAESRWLCLMLLHHLADDNTSIKLIFSEVQAHLAGTEDRLPAALPFRNYVAQARLGVSRAEHEAFFRDMLGDVEEPTAPFGLLDVWGDGSGLAEGRLRVEEGLAARLRERARALGVSAASLCHVAWAQVLARATGREDVVFGTVLFGRMQGGAGADRVLGPFINTLPVRLRVAGEGAEAGVRRAHGLLMQLLHHEHASLALAQRCSRVHAPTPLFSSILNYRHSAAGRDDHSPEEPMQGIRGLYVEERTNYPVGMSVDDLGEELWLTVQGHASVDPARVGALMHRALEGLTEALERSPETALGSIDVLPEAERRQVLEEWNATAAEYPRECIHELFERQAERTPDAPAVVHEGEPLTYAELNRRANRLAHHLQAQGVGPDSRVAICVERSPEMVVALLGVLKAGGAYVPLDPSYPAERLGYMLRDSAPVLVLTQERLLDRLPAHGAATLCLDRDRERIAGESERNPASGATPGSLAYVIYTSGSTGRPKGVMVEHRGLCNLVALHADRLGVEPSSRVLQFASFSFDGHVFEVVMALGQGASLHLAPAGVVLVGEALADLVQAREITHAVLPPAVLAALPGGTEERMSSLQTLIVSGDAPSAALMRHWSAGRRLINGYGPTEATVCATLHDYDGEGDGPPPIGRPIANTRIYVLDGRGEPVPVGVAGEIHIAGVGVARGYLNQPELTRERFVADPFPGGAGERMYRTGDLGRWLSDGTLEFVGRVDQQVKVRGFRIEPGEVEAALLEQAGVHEAVVVAREDAPGEKRLVAYYTGEALEAEALRSALGARLPEYMVPAAYVRLEELPLTPNGKLDRGALPAPEGAAYAARAFEAPRAGVESVLAEVWSRVLGVERVGRRDSFFELGGHSLLAVQVVGALRQAGVEVAIADLFAHPTLEALASRVAGDDPRGAEDRAIPVRPGGTRAPLFLIYEATGSVAYAQVLAPHVHEDVPVYALPSPSGAGPEPRTVQGMGSRLVRMIREVQPSGPYRVAGWSFGGTLAYEVALQLLGLDEQVEFVGLLDAPHVTIEGGARPEIPEDSELLLMSLPSLLRQAGVSDEEAQPAIAELQAGGATLDVEAVVRRCHELSLFPAEWTVDYIQAILHRNRLVRDALGQYVPQPTSLPVCLFSARDTVRDDPFRGWRSLLPEPSIRMIRVPGTHHSMLQPPHVEVLGRAISGAIEEAAEKRRGVPESGCSAPVFLRAGERSRVPLFCVPGAGASVVSFAELVASLDQGWPVYGLQPRGLGGDEICHTSVSAAAECHLRAVGEVQPAGPVHLLGHSFGGWVAFEMALRLRAAGRPVASLTILDSEVPDEDGALIREYGHGEAMLQLVAAFEQVAERSLGIGPRELYALDWSGQMELLHERLVRLGLMPRRSDAGLLKSSFWNFAACLRTTYRPSGSYADPLHLMLVRDPALGAQEDQERLDGAVRGWRRWAPGLVASEAPGNHMTALKLPHVLALASHLLSVAERNGLERGHVPTG
jgi:amino acid adenylation domain-containing protein